MEFFSVFVEPILSYQRILHLVSVLYITAQLTLISARRAKDCCRSPLLVAFKIPDFYFSPPVLFIQLTFHS